MHTHAKSRTKYEQIRLREAFSLGKVSRVLHTDNQAQPVISIDLFSSSADIPPQPFSLPISFLFHQSTSFYQFFYYFLIICSLSPHFWLPVSLHLSVSLCLPFYFIFYFLFSTTELIPLCDSSLTWPVYDFITTQEQINPEASLFQK